MKKLLYLFIILFLIGCTIYIGESDKPNGKVTVESGKVTIENQDKSKKEEKETIEKYFDTEYVCKGFYTGILKDKNTGNLYYVHRGTYGISINPIFKEDGKPLNIKDYEK